MKIAILTETFPSRTETFVLNQIIGLIDRGHEVDIYPVQVESSLTEQEDVKRYDLMRRVWWIDPPQTTGARWRTGVGLVLRDLMQGSTALLRLALREKRKATPDITRLLVRAATRRREYDIIYCHFGSRGRRGDWLRRVGTLRGQLVVVFHGFDLTKYVQEHGAAVYERLFQELDLALPVSERWRMRLLDLGCPAHKIEVHRMGIDSTSFPCRPRTEPDGPVRLLSVARLVEKKGLDDAIWAMTRLKDEFRVEYTIIGDGPLRAELEARVVACGLVGVVHFAGWQPHEAVVRAMSEAHLFLAPSVTAADGDAEGVPVSIMEAMATGLPVVTTRHSGIPELVEDGVSGYLVPERDVKALAEALTQLCRQPETWSRMGQAGRAFVETHHNVRVLNDQLVTRFEDLLIGRSDI